MLSTSKIKDIIKESNEEKLDVLIGLLLADKRKSVEALGKKLKNEKLKKEIEINRVKGMYNLDLSYGTNILIAGADEVGRGPLAGPITAAAVILDLEAFPEKLILEINDSKKISSKKREELSEKIKEKAIAFNIFSLDNKEIDEKGIGFCNQKVLEKAATGLNPKPALVLSDGYPIKNIQIKNNFIIKGDSKSASIACASIIAKVYRDNLMKEYAFMYPEYKLNSNAGYGSKEHIEAIKKYGITPIHRKSFLTNILG